MPLYLLTKPTSSHTVTYNEARAALVSAATPDAARQAADALMPAVVEARRPFAGYDATVVADTAAPGFVDRFFTGAASLGEGA